MLSIVSTLIIQVRKDCKPDKTTRLCVSRAAGDSAIVARPYHNLKGHSEYVLLDCYRKSFQELKTVRKKVWSKSIVLLPIEPIAQG